jgi:hypothetical protein
VRLTCSIALVVALSLPAILPAQSPTKAAAAEAKPPAPQIAWESDFDAALQRAQKEKKPLMVVFLQDNEPGNDAMVNETYLDPQIVKLTHRFVCLAGCMGNHKGDDGTCTKFPGLVCAQHQSIEKSARTRWLTSDAVDTPQHLFCDPKGQVLIRKIYLMSKQTMLLCMAMALQELGEDSEARSLIEADRARVDKVIKDAESHNLEVREHALRELVDVEDPRGIPAVLKVAKSGDDVTRLGAIAALAKKGNVQAVKPLCAMLSDPKAPIVIRVAQTLEAIRVSDALPDLMAAWKKEKRDRARGFILRAAARSSPGNAAVREAGLGALKGASTQLQGCILVALGHCSSNSKIIEVAKGLLSDKNQNTRGLAAWILGAQKCEDAETALETLLKTEKTPEVIEITRTALKFCRGQKVDGYDSMYAGFFSDYDY